MLNLNVIQGYIHHFIIEKFTVIYACFRNAGFNIFVLILAKKIYDACFSIIFISK
jgi:hypothetical protein